MADIQAPLRDPMEIKIFILYLMEHVDRPLTFVEVNDIIVQDGVVKAFDFYLTFPDLIDSGHIRKYTENNTEFYEITDIGRDAVHSFEDKLLISTKEIALKNAVFLLNQEKNEEELQFTDTPQPDGKHRIVISYLENKTVTLSASILAESDQEAKNIEFEFSRNQGLFRVALLSLLKNNAAGITSFDPYKLQ